MKRTFITAVMIMLALVVASARTEVLTEVSAGSGYRGNLFNDSNAIGDTYAIAGLRLRYYPSAATEFAAGARYQAYVEYGDLSSLSGDASLTVIPTPVTSPVTLALAWQVNFRKFGLVYKPYDQAGGNLSATLGYRLFQGIRLQSGVTVSNTVYTNSDYGSNRGVDISGGVNLTPFGSNSLALRADYSRRWFDQPQVSQSGNMSGSVSSEMFEITGLTVRYSRPLGRRTGLSLSGGYRWLEVAADYAVLGYTIDYLSPWSDLWEGYSVSATLKHIFPKQFKLELAAAWYDKQFVDVIELDANQGALSTRDSRDDRLLTSSLTISRPVLLRSGRLMTPTLSVGYRRNESTADYFDYGDLWGAFSLNVTF